VRSRPARLALALALAWVVGRGAAAEPARYELDPEHLTIAFLVEHIGYAKLLGAFRAASGGFTFDDTATTVSDVRVAVSTDSIDTAHDARDGHLKSGDFLDSAKHPEMIFTATRAERTGERTYIVTGELTLLGKTRPLTLEATLNKAAPYPIGNRAEVLGVSARGTLQRSEFGMTYGVADSLVGDDVAILIELEARRVAGEERR
jgi:polyisoprenoid-binding protein YceI